MEDLKPATGRPVPMRVRIVAFLWDYLLICGFLVLLIGVASLARPVLAPLFQAGPLRAELTGFLFLTLPVYLYFAISEGSRRHATWGKRKTGIVVAGVRGQPIGMGASLGRSALKFLPWELAHFTIWHMTLSPSYPDAVLYTLLAVVYGLALLYLVGPLWNKRRQTLYDAAAGTVIQFAEIVE
ncbi:RDD family protein [Cohnella nanjingensis]|nr:RDD family protein [Cohnella nanjingensis]